MHGPICILVWWQSPTMLFHDREVADQGLGSSHMISGIDNALAGLYG